MKHKTCKLMMIALIAFIVFIIGMSSTGNPMVLAAPDHTRSPSIQVAPQSAPYPANWKTVNQLSSGHYAGGVAYANGFAYVISGHDGNAKTNVVEYAPVNFDGTIGAWQTTSPVITERYASAAAATKGHIYLIGGQHDVSPKWLTSVEMATVNPDGSLSPWQETSPLTIPRDNLAAVHVGNHIYALGGTSTGWADQNTVEYAAIQPDGSLGTWKNTTSMKTIRKAVAAATDGMYIYAIGGGTGTLSAPLNSVERALVNPDGSLGAWVLQTNMNFGRVYATAVVAGDKLIVIGGYTNYGIILDSVEVATIGANGTLGPWESAEDLLEARYGAGSLVLGDYLFLFGGFIPPNITPPYSASINVDRAKIPPAAGVVTLTNDPMGQLLVENDYYRIELTNASSFVIKTGAGEREWRIFSANNSGGKWIGGAVIYEDHQSCPFWHFYGAPIDSITILERTPAQAVVQIITSGTSQGRSVRVKETLTFRADTAAIKIDSKLLESTHSSPVKTLEYHFFLGAGGDTRHDYYTWAGGTQTDFPYSGWHAFYENDFTPFTHDYIHISWFDTAVQQGLALVSRLSDTSDIYTDISYGRGLVVGEVYGNDPNVQIGMAGQHQTSFYLFPFTAKPANPDKPVKTFINSLGEPSYFISGLISDSGGNPISGVKLSTHTHLEITTNDRGYYIFTDLITGTYTLSPTLAAYTFSPPSRSISVPPSSSDQNFTGLTLAPPTHLHARPGLASIMLEWTPSTNPSVEGYNIYRSVSPTTGFVKINTSMVTGDAWSDTDPALIAGTTYYYYLTTLAAGQEGEPSNIASAIFGEAHLYIPELQGPHGMTVTVPINIANATGISIDSMDVYVTYDPAVVSIPLGDLTRVQRTILTLNYGFAINVLPPGIVHIVIATGSGSVPLQGPGTLFNLIFDVPGSSGDSSPLEFDVAQTDIYANGNLATPIPLSLMTLLQKQHLKN